MSETISIFDLLPEDDEMRVKYKPIKSTDWKWTMAEDYPKEKNGLKVFSCFACGGGSTMGYKLAGCDVIGCCEIDPKMNNVYVQNHHPKYNFLMDIRKFNETPNEELPEELFDLDILDGSPPCTTFSMAGKREESWGKKKKFREGQAEQTLDDLSFVFIDTIAKLRPKVVIMENVEGLLLGNAFEYVREMHRKFKEIGYNVMHQLLKGEQMGVPQTRHRVFFIATRLDFDFENLDLNFNYAPISYENIACELGKEPSEYQKRLLDNAVHTDFRMSDIKERIDGNCVGFTDLIVWKDKVLPTITANGKIFNADDKKHVSDKELIFGQTFPQDYNFLNNKVRYICGMSVPPIMIKQIVNRLMESGIFDYKLKGETQCTRG